MRARAQRLLRSQVAVVALLLCTGRGDPLDAQRRSPPVLVRRVIDGDTIDVASIGRVRLLGVAAPKIARRANQSVSGLAQEAQQRLSGLLVNRWVRLEYQSRSPERSSRSAYVFLEDGRFVNEWLVREGLARVSAGNGLSRSNVLARAQAEAQAARRGIWAGRRDSDRDGQRTFENEPLRAEPPLFPAFLAIPTAFHAHSVNSGALSSTSNGTAQYRIVTERFG